MYINLFDKDPLSSYSLGPINSGVMENQPFSGLWSGFYNKENGVYLFNMSGEGSIHIESTGYINASSFSFCFESGNGLYYSIEDEGVIKIHSIINNIDTQYEFNGECPQMFNNSVLLLSGNDTFCFYKKQGNTSNIYYKVANESFSIERCIYSGNSGDIKIINAVLKGELPPLYYRAQIFCSDNNGNGRLLTSNVFSPIKLKFNQNFENEETGITYKLKHWDIEESWRDVYFIDASLFTYQDFSEVPSGTYNGFVNDMLLLSKYTAGRDSFETSALGTITRLNSGYNISGGFFLNG